MSVFAQRLINLTKVTQEICCRAGKRTSKFLMISSLETFLCPIFFQKGIMLQYTYIYKKLNSQICNVIGFQKHVSMELQQQGKGHQKHKLNHSTLHIHCNRELSLEQQFDCNSVLAPNVNLFYYTTRKHQKPWIPFIATILLH